MLIFRLPAVAAILLFIASLIGGQASASTTILPPAKTCFSSVNGPVVAGTVNMFFPNTTTPKPTWQDSTQTTLNSSPIVLDGNGCALIYGVGSYRQQLYDSNGTLLFDATTTDTSAYNSTFWAGIAGGTPNVITVVDTGFNGTDGTVINFTALATNTASTTINPSSFGAIQVVKDTAAGPVALSGGEIVQNNIISVVYSASGNNFHLLNTAIASASGNTAPLCGANNLKIQNSAGTPNSIITMTADNVVMVTTAGLVINRGTVSQNVNISTGTVTSAAGGMDGEAPGTSSWIDLFFIDNGAAPAGLGTLASGNGKTPNMPSGYTYKCYMGAMRVDGSGNLLRTLQKGALAQYTLVSPSNTQNYPSVGTTTSATFSTMSVSSVVPPTAAAINVIGTSNTVNANLCIAPNSVGSATASSSTNPSALCWAAATAAQQLQGGFNLESTNIFAATNAGGTFNIFGFGWRDQVNAN